MVSLPLEFECITWSAWARVMPRTRSKGAEVVRQHTQVYLEAYTSVLTVGKKALEEFYGRKSIISHREVEQGADDILKDADINDVAFLVADDPFGAITYSDLILRATKLGLSYRVIHSASVINAVGCCGLQLCKFGETVSIFGRAATWRPESSFDKVKKNRQNSTHILSLPDIEVQEQSLENLIEGRKTYEPPWCMNDNQAAQQFLQIVQNQKIRGEESVVAKETRISLARTRKLQPALAANTYYGLGRIITFLNYHRRQHASSGDGRWRSQFSILAK